MDRPDGPGHARIISLTDAVVAIAMTLLVLPIVEAATEVDTRHLLHWLSENSDLLLSFVISFVVIHVFWSVHAGTLRLVEPSGLEVRLLRPLNMLWLLVIAFLPFPTAVVGHSLDTGSAPFYIGTMFLLSALTSGIVTAVHRVCVPGERRLWPWATTAVFALCAGLGAVNADLGMYSLLLLLVLHVVEIQWHRSHPSIGEVPHP